MKPLRFGLVGENVGYSLSPDIFLAMLAQLQLEGGFDVHSVTKQQLGVCVRHLVESDCAGFSVTIPHKEQIGQFLDATDESASSAGAINSVSIRDGSLTGHNTDRDGFTYSLRRNGFTGCDRALIIGKGGAARAVMAGLRHDFGVTKFVVCGRSNGDAVDQADRLQVLREHLQAEIEAVPPEECVGDMRAELIVNCTPLGGPNHTDKSAVPEGLNWKSVVLYYDLNYNVGNCMVAEAGRQGVVSMDGSAMLVAQAVKSFELWTGHRADFETVYKKVFPNR